MESIVFAIPEDFEKVCGLTQVSSTENLIVFRMKAFLLKWIEEYHKICLSFCHVCICTRISLLTMVSMYITTCQWDSYWGNNKDCSENTMHRCSSHANRCHGSQLICAQLSWVVNPCSPLFMSGISPFHEMDIMTGSSSFQCLWRMDTQPTWWIPHTKHFLYILDSLIPSPSQ